MKKTQPFLWLVLICMSLNLIGSQSAWPQYRGTDGTGTTSVNIPGWPNAGPAEVWRVPVGFGYGELAYVDGFIYTNTGDKEGEKKREYTICLDAKTGKEVWRRDMDELLETEFGHGARATPTIDGDSVYVLSAKGTLMALAIKDGTPRWTVNYLEAFGSKVPQWGFSNSPIVEGNLLIVTAGGKDEQFMVALDKKTGKKVWSSLKGRPGYATPTRVEVAGVRQMAIGASGKVMGIGLDGKPLWELPFGNSIPITMATFIAPDMFLFSSNDEKLAIMAKVQKEGNQFKATEAWRNTTYKTNYSSSVTRKGLVFGFDVGALKCIKASDGSLVWNKRGYGKGSLILADDKLIVLSDRGQLALVTADEEFKELGQIQALQGRCWTAPSMVEGKIYLRNMDEMVCYDLLK